LKGILDEWQNSADSPSYNIPDNDISLQYVKVCIKYFGLNKVGLNDYEIQLKTFGEVQGLLEHVTDFKSVR